MYRHLALFNQEEPPEDYIPGTGRAAAGFTTRSDIGPARAALPMDGYTPGTGRGELGSGEKRDRDQEDSAQYNPNARALGDDDGGLFSGLGYDKDDEEADAIWDSIDMRMDSRRKERRESLIKKKVQKLRKERPKIQQQFADLTEDLKNVSYADWDNIPDIGERTYKKKRRFDRYTPAPDSLLEQARRENTSYNTIDRSQQLGGDSVSAMTPVQDLTKLGIAKQTIIRSKLEKVADSITGQTSIDPKGYMTALSYQKVSSSAEVGDKKRLRALLKSVTSADPKHPPAWIARARLEEDDGKLTEARKIISLGYNNCPNSEDVWLEAARIHPPEEAKTILAHAANRIPTSVRVWLAAAKLETENKKKKRVLRKGLEHIPNSVRLWQAAVRLENPENACIMLRRAVECIPTSVEMWLALAKIETGENAKRVLNDARKALPTERMIWIAAAQLKEANGEEGIQMVINRGIRTLIAHGVEIRRDVWLTQAEHCEKLGSIKTCQAIIMETIGHELEDEDKLSTWIEEAEECIARKSFCTARAIYAHASTVFPYEEDLWLLMGDLERRHGTREDLMNVLSTSVTHCQHSYTLWMMYAKETWKSGMLDDARKILFQAFSHNSNNERIWLAAVKLEKENNEYEKARDILEKARDSAGTQNVWMKSALIEREMGNREGEKRLLTQAIRQYPKFHKFHIMLGQYHEKESLSKARGVYIDGLKQCSDSIPLWLCLVRLEEKLSGTNRARTILEKARTKLPESPQIWLESVRLEYRSSGKELAMNMMSKALQKCPLSGVLWAEFIEMTDQADKRARVYDALNTCDEDPYVITAAAKLFCQNEQFEKARVWYNRAVDVSPDIGDCWAALYRFEQDHGTEETLNDVVKRCGIAEPRYGEKWISISKNENNVNMKHEDILVEAAKLM
eukprot:TRINITY_DN210_c0_g1_i2.p1 TRINITY_DN210_c0_g1~~TRINITY_DN210_c0_g1_i2.p1  ORF type:complete len:911 (-),score=270.15 TRINITY_DN210_c0_g1_i2:21-2753(-)